MARNTHLTWLADRHFDYNQLFLAETLHQAILLQNPHRKKPLNGFVLLRGILGKPVAVEK